MFDLFCVLFVRHCLCFQLLLFGCLIVGFCLFDYMLNGFVCSRVVFDALFALFDICVRCLALDLFWYCLFCCLWRCCCFGLLNVGCYALLGVVLL